ncbi:MAG TPA: phage major capsid protein [Paralcaligenes sp.]
MMKRELQKRLAEIQGTRDLKTTAKVASIDVEARTVELAFSSEAEYRRWWGIEVLGHEPGEVDLSRLNDGAAVLWNHNWDTQVGVVESARVDSDKKGRATVRFSRNARADEIFQDIVDKIITKVSVGYRIQDAKLIEERDGEEVWRVTDWQPYEISPVSVPADASVGIGRSMEAENPQEESAAPPAQNSTVHKGGIQLSIEERAEMKIKTVRNAAGHLVRAEVDEADNDKIVRELEVIEYAGAERAAGEQAERSRVNAITEMGKRYGATDLALEFVGNGQNADAFQRALLERMNERKAKPLADQAQPSSQIGLTDTEARSYSLMRVVRALANPNDARLRKDAAFEFECSEAAQRQFGREAKGVLIPEDVLARAFNAGGAANLPVGSTTGSELVATTLMAGSFIEALRHRTTIMRLGFSMAGLVGNVEIPKQTGGATAYWVGEGEDATEGVPTIGQIALSPKTVAAYTDITRKLMQQSTPDAEGIVRRDLVNAIAQALDYAGYYGTGVGNQPKGIKNYTGINSVDFAVANPTFAELVSMESAIAADNADVNSMAYVANAKFRGHCKTTPKFGAGTEATIWEPGGTVNGYRSEITNQVADGDVFFGNFSDLIVALWGGLDLTVDPYSLSKSGGTRLVVFQDADFVLRREESMCYGVLIP